MTFLELPKSPVSSLAYVMFTSGTTGKPKGVYVPHSCVVSNITALSEMFSIKSSDVVWLASPPGFDPSVIQMFTAFSAGNFLIEMFLNRNSCNFSGAF